MFSDGAGSCNQPAVANLPLDGVLGSDALTAPHGVVLAAELVPDSAPVDFFQVISKACFCLYVWPVDGVRELEGVVGEDKAVVSFAFGQQLVYFVLVALEAIDGTVANSVVLVRRVEVLQVTLPLLGVMLITRV